MMKDELGSLVSQFSKGTSADNPFPLASLLSILSTGKRCFHVSTPFPWLDVFQPKLEGSSDIVPLWGMGLPLIPTQAVLL